MDRAEKTVENAREIARRLGEPQWRFVCGRLAANDDAFVYEDDVVVIAKRGVELEIERKANHNPCVMVWEDGRIIRYHGETRYIENHIDLLAEGLYSDFGR